MRRQSSQERRHQPKAAAAVDYSKPCCQCCCCWGAWSLCHWVSLQQQQQLLRQACQQLQREQVAQARHMRDV
jgi:hypothetical protein